MRNKFWVGLGLSTCLTTPAAAENWYLIATTDETTEYADADSIRRHGSISQVQIFRGFASGTGPQGTVYYAKIAAEITCATNQFHLTKTDSYNGSKAYIGSDTTATGWETINSDSIADKLRQFVCEAGVRSDPVSDPFDHADEYWYYYAF